MPEGRNTPTLSIEDNRALCDEIWIGAQHPFIGFVSFMAVRSGCTEADELVPDYEVFAKSVVAAVNERERALEIIEGLVGLAEMSPGKLHQYRAALDDAREFLSRARASTKGEGK